MADNVRKYIYGTPFTTPRVRLGFSYLYKPNSEGRFPSKKYEVTWRVPKSDTLFMSLIDRMIDEVFKANLEKGLLINNELKKLTLPYKDGDVAAEEKIHRASLLKKDLEKVTKNASYDRGHWLFKAKSKNKPVLFGYARPSAPGKSSEAPLPEGTIIEINDIVRLSLQAGVYLLEEDLTEGINLSFSNVQFMEKGTGGAARSATFGDDPEADTVAPQTGVTFE